VIPLLLAAGAAATGGAAEFMAAYPSASVVLTSDRARLSHASAFEAPSPGKTPEAAALAFLQKFHAAFGITSRQKLVAKDHPQPGQAVILHFERRIDGQPVFDGDIVVAMNAGSAVTLVNSGDVPAKIGGRMRISRQAAINAAQAAIPGLEGAGTPKAVPGWRTSGKAVAPMWRVDFSAAQPAGDWRSYVNGESGKVVERVDLRSTSRPPGVAPGSQGLPPRPKDG
jgi:Zn-dependent metalloprotease